MRIGVKFVISILILGLAFSQNLSFIQRRSWLDSAGLSAKDLFESGDVTKDYTIGFTETGTVLVKKTSDEKIPEASFSFNLENINPTYYSSCWQDRNRCIFAGYYRMENWFIGDSPTLTNVFAYGSTTDSSQNRYWVVKVIEGTDYFVAAEKANAPVTRWLATDNEELSQYAVNGNSANECEEIHHIMTTQYVLVNFDNTNPIHMIDLTNMSLVRDIQHGTNTYVSSKATFVNYWSDAYRIFTVQDNSVSTNPADINIYNYSDGSTVLNFAAFQPSPQDNPVISIASVQDAPFIFIGFKFTLVIYRMETDSTVGYPSSSPNVPINALRLSQMNPLTKISWYEVKKQFIITFAQGQDLVRGVLFPFCSPECDATHCVEDKPFFAEGCNICSNGGAAPVNGACPQPATPYSKDPATLTGGNGQFQTASNIKAASIPTFDGTPDAGNIVLNQKLTSVKDPERNTAHLIGGILAGIALTALYCFLILFCFRRRKKKKEEKKIYIREMQKVGKPIWMNGADVSSDSEEEEKNINHPRGPVNMNQKHHQGTTNRNLVVGSQDEITVDQNRDNQVFDVEKMNSKI